MRCGALGIVLFGLACAGTASAETPLSCAKAAASLVALPAAAQEEAPAPALETPPPVEAQPRPSIVVDARDDLGRAVRSVTLFVDDKPVAYELDGQPVELAPGAHTVTVQRNDGPRQRVTATVTLGEGDARLPVRLAFERPPAEPTVLEAPESTPILPRVVAGAGLVGVVTGVVLLLARPNLPTNCSSDTFTCTRLAAQTDTDAANDRETTATNRDLGRAGLVTLLSGAAVTAGGVLWYVLDTRQTAKPRTAKIAPWLLGEGAGVVLRARF